ncbi:hypothetical protein WG908_03305 [Sphingobium sp. AN641]|uniref:hypothetical protein n=1 Tax=Sphingobium sp. AN641 TaxID=3133443 RepID=UPI0030BD7A85
MPRMPYGGRGDRFGGDFGRYRPDDMRRRSGFGPSFSDYEDGSQYRDYNDSTYTDHYVDNNYQDLHDPDYRISAKLKPWEIDPDIIHKIVVLKPDGSGLLAGDPDHGSGLFEDSQKNDAGFATDVLPKLLNAGWLVHSVQPGLSEGEKLVVLARSKPPRKP